MRRSLEERFVEKVDFSGDCWLWTGATALGGGPHPYGRIWSGTYSPKGHSVAVAAHRVSYEIYVGPVPDHLELDHLCRNTLCVNPDHLEAVTHRENQLRGFSPMGLQARQTHCKRGHPFDEQNTYFWEKKRLRRCRACQAEQAREYRQRRREMVT